MIAKLEIRKIKESELGRLIQLYAHYTSKENVPQLSEEKIREVWTQIQLNPCINYFVMEENGVLMASCILNITPSFIRGGDGYGFIEHVVVHTDFRRKGYGKTMVTYALNHAWNKKCTEVMLLSGSKNEKAHRMYEQLKFEKYRKQGFIKYNPLTERTLYEREKCERMRNERL